MVTKLIEASIEHQQGAPVIDLRGDIDRSAEEVLNRAYEEAITDGAQVMKEAVSACVTRASGLADALSHKSAMSHRDFRNNALALYEFADQVLERCDDIARWAELREEARNA